MMEYIYIISTQRGQGSPEIFSIWSNNDDAIKSYYNYFIINKHEYLDFIYLYKYPIGKNFCGDEKWSKIKLQKSCKFRVKFKSFKDLKNEYEQIIRSNKLERVLKIND